MCAFTVKCENTIKEKEKHQNTARSSRGGGKKHTMGCKTVSSRQTKYWSTGTLCYSSHKNTTKIDWKEKRRTDSAACPLEKKKKREERKRERLRHWARREWSKSRKQKKKKTDVWGWYIYIYIYIKVRIKNQ